MNELKDKIKELFDQEVLKIIISSPVKSSTIKKIIIKKLEDKYKSEVLDSNKIFQEDIEPSDIVMYIFRNMDQFKQINIWDSTYEHNLRITKKGKFIYGKSRITNMNMESHDKQKNYILKEGEIIPPLVDLGIFTKDGRIVKSMYSKYKQINKFLEIVDDALKNYHYDKLNIIDFGCGRSYLTFILYYYFTHIKNIEVNMIGLDLKKNVIEECNKITESYGYNHLKFELGDINGYETKMNVDMVVTLHACDTATDYALYNAIKWNAKRSFPFLVVNMRLIIK